MKKFKAKKIKKRKKIKVFRYVFLLLFITGYIYAFSYCKNNNNKLDNNVLNESINFVKLDLIKIIDEKINNVFKSPVTFLNNNIKKIEYASANSNVNNLEETKNVVKAEEDIKVNDNEFKPVVYIYNTHETEKYNDYSVEYAASLLSDYLNNSGIDTYFEEKSVSAFLQTNNLKYYKSYNVSKQYLNAAKEKYNSLNYYFDIHRDSVSKEKSTIVYNDKSYAKIMFIVGKENSNYKENLNNANKLNDIIKSKVPNISRGIMQKEGKDVDGVYNQDFSSNLFLIELGAVYNTKEEVINTLEILKESIIEYIKGDI